MQVRKSLIVGLGADSDKHNKQYNVTLTITDCSEIIKKWLNSENILKCSKRKLFSKSFWAVMHEILS